MATTTSKYLKLRIGDDLTADAVYNLNRIDLLGQSVDITGSANQSFRASGNVLIEPNAADLGGTGVGGTVYFGDANHTLSAIEMYVSSLNVSGTISATSLILGGDTVATLAASQTLTNKTIDASANTITNIPDSSIATNAAISLSKLAAVTANKALKSDSSGTIVESIVTNTELEYLSGVTSGVQSQIDTKEDGLGNPPVDGYILSSSSGGTREWIESPAVTAQSGTFDWTSGTSLVINHNFNTTNVDLSIFNLNTESFEVVERVEYNTGNQLTLYALEEITNAKVYVRSTSA